MNEDTIPGEVIDEAQAAPIDNAAPPAEEAAPQHDKSRDAGKRIAKLTYEREEARRQSAAKDQIIAELRGTHPAQPTIDAQVEARAIALTAEKKFNEECNLTFANGLKEFPDFAATIRAFDDIGGLGVNPEFLDAVNSLPNGHAILKQLSDNLDEASDLMSMKPAKMALKLAELSGTLAKPTTKQLSRTPAPPDSITGRTSAPSKDPEKMSMTEFAAWRAQVRKSGH